MSNINLSFDLLTVERDGDKQAYVLLNTNNSLSVNTELQPISPVTREELHCSQKRT